MTRAVDSPVQRAQPTSISSGAMRSAGGVVHDVERRSSARFDTVFRLGKLVGEREELCVIRNVSAFGLRLQVFSPQAIGASLGIDLGDNAVRPAKIVWREGDYAGVSLNEEIDVPQVLSGLPPPGDRRGRRLRFTIHIDGLVGLKGKQKPCRVIDISQGGARLRTADTDLIPERTRLELAGLGKLSASVRWVEGDYVGIAFAGPLPYRQLAGWLPDRGGQTSPEIDRI